MSEEDRQALENLCLPVDELWHMGPRIFNPHYVTFGNLHLPPQRRFDGLQRLINFDNGNLDWYQTAWSVVFLR